MSTCKYFTKIECPRTLQFICVESDGEAWTATARVQHGIKEARSKDSSSWSMHGNLWFIVAINHADQTLAHMTTECWGYLTMTNFAVNYWHMVCTVAEVASGKDHEQTTLKIQLMIWVWSLVHACDSPEWQHIVTNPAAVYGLCAMTQISTWS